MNTHRTLLLLVALTSSAVALAPFASAAPPPGYTCVFNYNPGADANVCYAPAPSATPGSSTIPLPCVIGDFPCFLGPVDAPGVVVGGTDPYVGFVGSLCRYHADIIELNYIGDCLPTGGLYVCTKHAEFFTVDRCTS